MSDAEIVPVINMIDFAQADESSKLDLIMVALNKLNTMLQKKSMKIECALTEKENGVFPRLQDNESDLDRYSNTLIDYQNKVTKLEDEIAQLKGIVQVQDRQIGTMRDEITKLKARSMKKNIVVSGITGDEKDEDCKQQSKAFLDSKLKRPTDLHEIKVAHWLGPIKQNGKPRPMVIKCGEKLCNDVFGYTKNLRNQKNSLGDKFYIDPQVPDEMAAERRALMATAKRWRQRNNELEPEHRTKVEIRGKKLFINSV